MINTPYQWKPFTGTYGDVSEDYSIDRTTVNYRMQVSYTDWVAHNVPFDILGYGRRVESGGDIENINRILPRLYPMTPAEYYAVRVSNVQYQRFKGTEGGGKGREVYDKVNFTVTFQQLPYPVISDGNVGAEHNRFVEKTGFEPNPQFLKLDRGKIQYIADDGVTPEGRVVSTRFDGYLQQQANVTWTWHRVPKAYLFGTSPLPSRLMDAVGTINNAAFEGFGARQLLCLPTRIEPMLPGTPLELLIDQSTFPYPTEFRVTIPFMYYPPGHDTAPDKNDPTSNRKIKFVSSDGLTLREVYPETDFQKIFWAGV